MFVIKIYLSFRLISFERPNTLTNVMIKIIQIFYKTIISTKQEIKPEKSLGVKNFFFVNLVIKAVILQVSNTDLSALVNITFLRCTEPTMLFVEVFLASVSPNICNWSFGNKMNSIPSAQIRRSWENDINLYN